MKTIQEQLAADEALCEAATPGPWQETYMRAYQGTPYSKGMDIETISATGPVHEIDKDITKATSDSAFIAAARTMLPRYIKAVELARQWVHGEFHGDSPCPEFDEAILKTLRGKW